MKYIKADWPAPAQVKTYTTTRDGWGGRYPHPSHLSLAGEGESLRSLLHLPSDPVWLNQIHGTTVVEANPGNTEQTADASYAIESKRVCVISTADCLPVLICNKNGTHVAAIHAGWRGLAAGIIENTVTAINQPASDLLVWLGPAIGPQKFEVGKDVYEAFTQKHTESAPAFTPCNEDKWLANIYALARIRLRFLGISNIYGGDYCTYTQEELFFSYRRDKGKTGRMASLIWIEDE